MVKVSIRDDVAVFSVQGLHKLWAFKSRLEVRLSHIKAVRADPTVARGLWKGIRAPGTHLPGIITAGTYYRKRLKKDFWDVSNPEHAIVVELEGEPYQRLVIEVEDPSAEVARLSARA
jgi:hypothetical protein